MNYNIFTDVFRWCIYIDNNIRLRDFLCHLIEKDWLQQLIHFIFAILASVLIKQPFFLTELTIIQNIKYQISIIILLIAYLVTIIFFSIINKKADNKQKNFLQIKDLNESTLILEGSITNINESFVEERMKNGIFNSVASVVCNIIYNYLSFIFNDKNIRVCITKQIVDNNNRKFIKQVGYRTHSTMTASNERKPLNNFKYYVSEIIQTNTEDYYILLTEEEVLEHLKFKKTKEKSVTPKQFIAIPYKGVFNKICFVLQIDFSNANTLKGNIGDVEKFINAHLRFFVLRLGNIYYTDYIKQSEEK